MTAHSHLSAIAGEFRARMESEGALSRAQAASLAPAGFTREAAEEASRSLGDGSLFVSATFGPDLQRALVSFLGETADSAFGSTSEFRDVEAFASGIPEYEDALLGISLSSARTAMARLDALAERVRAVPEGNSTAAAVPQASSAPSREAERPPRPGRKGSAFMWLALAAGAYAGVHFVSRGTSLAGWFPIPFVSGATDAGEKENEGEEGEEADGE